MMNTNKWDHMLSEKFVKANDQMSDFGSFVPAPYFRKSFMLDFVPEEAGVTICGLGFYELYINGINVTKGPMAPYISNTDDICYYDGYDITKLLKKGENVIGVLLGNGFRNPYGGFIWDFEKSTHRGPVTFALCLKASAKDVHFELEADEGFQTHPSPIQYDDLRMGYCYDAGKEIPDWNMPGFDDSTWEPAQKERTPRGTKKLCEADPIVVVKELEAVDVTYYEELPFGYESGALDAKPLKNTVKKDVYVYDFGVNTAGVTKLRINGKPGQKIIIRHGEHKVQGKFAVNTTMFNRPGGIAEKYLEYGQTDVFICKGGEETFVPKFKYDGFRYAYVEGLVPEQAGKNALTLLEMHSDLKGRAGFTCSDEVFNKLQENTRRSDLANFFYFPTDCPHREKNGWTGDASMSAEHMLLNLTAEKSLKAWLANVRASQNEAGALPGIVPTGGWGFAWGNGPAWDSVCVNLPYYIYKYTGDKSVIQENVSMIMRYLCYAFTKRKENGLVAFGLGDWVDPNQDERKCIAAPLEVTDSIMLYDIAQKAAFLFETVGRTMESAYAKGIAEEMRKAIRENLINKADMTVAGDCQTSQAFALAVGIFNEEEKAEAGKRLVEIIHRDGDVNACGMIGLRHVFHVLADIGEQDLAYKMITSKHQHCYGYWVANNATSMWESFRGINDPNTNSKNHHFLGDISSWLIQSAAGLKINPHADDITYVEISPAFIKDLSFAKAYFDSGFGRVEVQWERNGKGICIAVTIPEGMHGKLLLNHGEISKEILPGKYLFEI